MKSHSRWRNTAFGAAVLLSACASTPPPRDELARADTAIKQAEQAGATEHAPAELREARMQYEQASRILANQNEDQYPDARRLAERAVADAQLAAGLTRAKRAETITSEVRRGVQTLQQELDRPTGGAP